MILSLLAILVMGLMFLLDWRRTQLNLFDYLVVRVTLVYCRFWHRWQCNRPSPFPLDSGCLIASNHTCSSDPVMILAGCRYPVGFVVAKEHHNLHPIARWILDGIHCVPVTRGGKDHVAIRRIMRTVARGRAICLFPEGNLSGVRRNRLGKPRPGIGYLVLKTGLPVFPIFIHGGPRTDRLLRSWLLPSPRAAKVIFGPEIDMSAYRGQPLTRKLVEDATAHIMRHIAALDPRQMTRAHAPE